MNLIGRVARVRRGIVSGFVLASVAFAYVSHADSRRRYRVDIELPTRASDAFLLRDRVNGVSVSVRPHDATPVPAVVENSGEIEMRAAMAVNGDVTNRRDIWLRSRSNGLEDFVDLGDLDDAELAYDITLGENVAGLRWVQGVLELLDPNTKTFSATPNPQLYDHRARSTATLLVPDRVLVAGKADSLDLPFAEIYDGR